MIESKSRQAGFLGAKLIAEFGAIQFLEPKESTADLRRLRHALCADQRIAISEYQRFTLLSRSKSRTEPLLEILSQESGIQHERA